ncbi:efflux RND transporter periplasmic adaptor subunit [Bradyrhizobium frederickii]|uniref:Efflux RND transporter periplasmic adaptor subunit n=1 Tax=Bradyrhizobium frederickii TaxID=2560054 RepID=A0A4Y9L910_9BRAD|nr:efflux RND transporter periplasmic adaptor subunit [Bradyrhizobium frederickii]TFV38272.1 efflux RND transporter periplasmic adaptor subunit [Bradyrhizobium frederickii]
MKRIHRGLRSMAIMTSLVCHSTVHAESLSFAMTVVAASVERSEVTRTITATGNVVAWREIPVSSEAGGLAVIEVAVDEGDVVVKGQVLARLSHDLTAAAISKQKAAIGELEASLAIARSDAARAHSVSSGVMSAQAIEQRETLVKTTEAKLEAARAQLDEAEARQRQTVVIAPAAGTIASRSVAIGQVVQAGVEMFRLIQDDRIEVDARVVETDLLAAAAGQHVMVLGPGGRSEYGSVRLVSPVVDPKTRLGTVHVALPRGTNLKPGMFARVEISAERKLALTVPLKALVWREAKAHVFKIGRDSLVSLVEIGIGAKESDDVEVLRGLEAGDRIVTQGAGLLSDGDFVNVKTASVKGGALR